MTFKTSNTNGAPQDNLLELIPARAREATARALEANAQFRGCFDSLPKHEQTMLQERADTELTRLQNQGHRM